MNSSSALIRAMRGPVMLITVGTLFAFDQMTQLDFGSTWPVIIIIFGGMKLAESMAAKAYPTQPEAGRQ